MVAGLGRSGDAMRYYELNPAVVGLVGRHFTFLKEGKAETDVLLGDGRLVLERQLAAKDPQQFDVLIAERLRQRLPADASDDARGLRRLSRASRAERRARHQLRAGHVRDGASAASPGMAKAFGLDVNWFETPETDECEQPISWALYSRDKGFFAAPDVAAQISKWRDDGKSELVWTDKDSNLMSILNWGK